MSNLDHYSYQNLLRDRLQIDLLRHMRGDDGGIRHDLKVLMNGSGVKSIKDLTGDALMDFAKKALAIIHPQEEAAQPSPGNWPPVSEGPLEPNGKGWFTFDEACLPEEDRDPGYIGKEEASIFIKALVLARGALGNDVVNEVLFAHTGEPAFSAMSLKDGEGLALAIKLLSSVADKNGADDANA